MDKPEEKKNKNKGGRPKLIDPNLTKNHKFTIYLNTYEKELIDEYFEKILNSNIKYGPLFTEIILKSIQNKSINITNIKPTIEISALNSIGNNINQIAKKLNSVHHLNANDLQKYDNLLDKLLILIQGK